MLHTSQVEILFLLQQYFKKYPKLCMLLWNRIQRQAIPGVFSSEHVYTAHDPFDITLRNILTFSHPFSRNLIYFSKEKNRLLTSLVNCIVKRKYLLCRCHLHAYGTCSCVHCNLHCRIFIESISETCIFYIWKSGQCTLVKHFCVQTWRGKLVSISSQQNTHIDVTQNYAWTYIQNWLKESSNPGCLASRESGMI